MDFEKSHTDEVTEYFAHKNMNNFWKSWNAKYCKHVNASNISINGYQKEPFREHYVNIFINSANERNKVNEFNKMRLHYIGDTHNDALLSVEDIESAVRHLKKGKAGWC